MRHPGTGDHRHRRHHQRAGVRGQDRRDLPAVGNRGERTVNFVGGLYGVSLGRAFFGESMFSAIPNASKAALITLIPHLQKRG
ncbi:MAG: hypothetical protein Q8M76_03360, partial [Spirochaetaceae bacterium]|nr:hypothetical protein [Spirochaetaceae bacterium]